jgi:1-deoxy-D-xylulose-5-phosphate synthase
MTILERIESPADLKKLSKPQLVTLAGELRSFILEKLSPIGGHLASSLGVVELTIALHYIFSTPEDRIIWDVGHQSYPHKILTGRRDKFATIRQQGGLSGFPKRCESPHDAFGTGHSSTSISAALGMAVGRDLGKRSNKVVAVIGDGSMTSGMAFEGLNHAGHEKKDLVVILNDNDMSISPNVGALSSYLSRLLTGEFYSKVRREVEDALETLPLGDKMKKLAKKIEEHAKGFITPGMLFEELGFNYVGPIDGHNMDHLLVALGNISKFNEPTLVHVVTRKGKGFEPAEDEPTSFHGVGPFNLQNGESSKASGATPSYTSVFGKTLVELAEKDDRLIAITAAMPEGTGLTGFADKFPSRFYDVGIAEEHAVTFAAGLATEGWRPVVAIYSTFLQRSYDQIIHDVALQNLPVIFALDRAGLVGADGPTHHGVFDLSFLRHIPNLCLMVPSDENELRNALATAVACDGPAALRYPRGAGVGVELDSEISAWPLGKGRIVFGDAEGEGRVVVFSAGTVLESVLDAAQVVSDSGISITVFDARFVKPLDEAAIVALAKDAAAIVTVEENALMGGFGAAVLETLSDSGVKMPAVKRLGLPDSFVGHGTQAQLRRDLGLDSGSIADTIKAHYEAVRAP